MSPLTVKPVQPLPANLPAAPALRNEDFPHPVASRPSGQIFPEQFHLEARTLNSPQDGSVRYALEFLNKAPVEEPPVPGAVDNSPSNLQTRGMGNVAFEAALAGAQRMSRLHSGVTMEEVGTVALLQARNGAYFAAWAGADEEANPTKLRSGDGWAATSPQIKALVDDSNWVDLRNEPTRG